MKSSPILASGLLMGLAAVAADAAETAADAVAVENAYVREVPPVSRTSAAFMTLRNTGVENHAVVAARTPAAAIVELHTHLMGDDGMHRMREVEQVEVRAGGEAVLQPGGLHVMLINLTAPLKAGDQVELTLVYDDDSEETIAAEVKTIESTMMMHKSPQH
jgi:copper(I)-binding protein